MIKDNKPDSNKKSDLETYQTFHNHQMNTSQLSGYKKGNNY
jgi:hypothetical protein